MHENTVSLQSRRLHSLDALRGLDMLLIIGLSELLRALAPVCLSEDATNEIWRQLGHCRWEGLTVYDLIFPIFVFISGASMYYALKRAKERGKNKIGLAGKLWKRALVLALLGCAVNAYSRAGSMTWDPSSWRYASVLGLIGISCAFAGTLMIGLQRAHRALIAAACILLVIGVVQRFGGDMTPEGCFNAKVDALICPGALHSGSFDPEGPLCLISATALALLGYFAGSLSGSALTLRRQVLLMLLAGAVCLGLGSQVGMVIKGIWTPAFVLTTGGIGFLLLSVFRPACDAWALGSKLSLPLRIVGMNALFIYLLTHLPGYRELWRYLLAPLYEPYCSETCAELLTCTFFLLGGWMICFALWKKRIFIKV